jgi:hypothetical protein
LLVVGGWWKGRSGGEGVEAWKQQITMKRVHPSTMTARGKEGGRTKARARFGKLNSTNPTNGGQKSSNK